MKVYYISSGFDGCYYVRCLLPLVAGGWDGSQTSLLTMKANKDEVYAGATNADIVVFQRPMEKSRLEAAKLLKQAGKKIVMDNDDTYVLQGGFLRPILGLSKKTMEAKRQQLEDSLNEFAKIADLVTVSTPPLAKEYSPYNKNIEVLPNCVDPDDWEKPLRNETDTIRIGLVGSVVVEQDYQKIKPIIKKLVKRPNVKLVVFSLPPKSMDTRLAQEAFKDEFKFWLSKDIEWQPFVPIDKYAETLNNLKLDFMLIPRKDDYFNRCKSNVKFLEASMCEIPVITQEFKDKGSPYHNDRKYLLMAKTQKDWERQIDKLIKNKKLRRAMGKRAHNYVIKKYNIHNNIKLWEKAYQKIWNREQ